MHRILMIFILSAMLLLMAISCTGKGGGVASTLMPTTESETAIAYAHQVIGVWSAEIDPDAKTFTVTPDVREGSFHFPLTIQYPNVLTVVGHGWTPNFWVDIKLKHPFPGTNIKPYDPRIIAILPGNPGVGFYYPVMNVNANNSVLSEPDGYTSLYDYLGGSISGNANPFKAYFKDQPYRVWSDTGVTEETQRWKMNLTGFGGPLRFTLVVDISTNYPNPPQPVIDNVPEPFKIDALIGQGLSKNGGSANVTVTLLDWQAQGTIGGVAIEAPDLFNGAISLPYSRPGLNPNEYIYTGIITNEKLAPEGGYKILVATWDRMGSIHLYNEFTVLVSGVSDGGNLVWAKHTGGRGYDYPFGITSLSDDSTVVTGYFEGSSAFGKQEQNQTILTSAGDWDIFIARYNPNGTLAWAKRAGGSRIDSGSRITTLSDNSIVVMGCFSGSATFGQGEANETVLTSNGDLDIFFARYNPDGTLAWVKSAGGLKMDVGWGITALSDNAVIVTGCFSAVATFGKNEQNQTDLTSAGGKDIFIARYNPDGTLEWAKRAGGANYDYSCGEEPNYDWGSGAAALSDDSTVITGHFSDSAIFGKGEANQTVLVTAGCVDIFIARYNPDGTLAWAKRAGWSKNDTGLGITALSDDSVVVTGGFGELAIFGQGEINEKVLYSAGNYDVFIARYNPNGTLAWAKNIGGTDSEESVGITALSDNSVVVTGYFAGTATFGIGDPNWTNLTADGINDVFITRYNMNGMLVWAKRAGGTLNDSGEGVTTLSDDSTVLIGRFWGKATFGPGESKEITLSSAGSEDVCVARFKP